MHPGSRIGSVYLCRQPVDFRKQIDGLAALVLQSFGQDPCQNVLYLFCGRRSDRFKALYWVYSVD